MDAEIRTVDKDRRDSDGHRLSVRGGKVEAVVQSYGGLPLGEARDRLYVEVRAVSWEGSTQSTVTAQLNAEDLQRIFDVAKGADLIVLGNEDRLRS